MDEGARAELTIGNNMISQANFEKSGKTAALGRVKTKFELANKKNIQKQGESKDVDYGTDTIEGAQTAATASRVTTSFQKAKSGAIEAKVAALPEAEQASARALQATGDLKAPKSVGTGLSAFMSGGHQMGEAKTAVADFGQKFTTIAGGEGATKDADSVAGVGVPTLVSKGAKVFGVGAGKADAIGDLVGHSVGLGMSLASGISDVSGGWGKMDKDEKVGNVLGIAGGIVDSASTFMPALAVVGVGLDVAGSVFSYIGDSNKAAEQKKKTLDPAQAAATTAAAAKNKVGQAQSVTSQGQVANQQTRSLTATAY